MGCLVFHNSEVLIVAKSSHVTNYTCGCHREVQDVGAYAGKEILIRCRDHSVGIDEGVTADVVDVADQGSIDLPEMPAIVSTESVG